MMGWGWGGMGWVGMWLGLVLMLAVTAAVVYLIVAAVGRPPGPVSTVGPAPPGAPPPAPTAPTAPAVSDAERILEERFARGEIDAEALARGRQALRNR